LPAPLVSPVSISVSGWFFPFSARRPNQGELFGGKRPAAHLNEKLTQVQLFN
jgi:hypothetical protein